MKQAWFALALVFLVGAGIGAVLRWNAADACARRGMELIVATNQCVERR